jgi:tetratricopeptide (TPR) repeat protein
MTFESLMDYGRRHLAAQEWRLAAERFGEAQQLDEHSPLPRAALGRVALVLGRKDEALALLDAVLAEHPKCVEALITRAMADDEDGRTEEAVARYERALAIAPEEPEALAGVGLALARLGRWSAARRALKRAMASMSEPSLLSAYAIAAYRDGDAGEALAVLCHCIAKNPNHVDSVAALADLLVAVGRQSTAAQLLDNTLVRRPDEPTLKARRQALA